MSIGYSRNEAQEKAKGVKCYATEPIYMTIPPLFEVFKNLQITTKQVAENFQKLAEAYANFVERG